MRRGMTSRGTRPLRSRRRRWWPRETVMLERCMTEDTCRFEYLTDDQLLVETKRLVACERSATAAVLRSLMEIDARRLYLREGCSSLFTYCTQVLHLAEGAAYNRIEAARAARRFSELLVALEDGALTLTAVRLLAPHFTPDNHRELIARARHKSKRDVELLVAALAPRAPVATVVRRLPERRTVPVADLPTPSLTPSGHGKINQTTEPERSRARAGVAAGSAGSPSTAAQPCRPLAASVTPLSPAHYRLQVTLREETHAKLRRAQDLLRHAIPDGDVSTVLDRALTLLVADLERRRCAATPTPRSSGEAEEHGRYVPAAVKRAVWTRDEGRCAFVGTEGRCAETAWLEFHHVQPYADGGRTTLANLQLRCRAHNQYEAGLWFGSDAEEVRESRPEYGYTLAFEAACSGTSSARWPAIGPISDQSRSRAFRLRAKRSGGPP
jgi:HNH endonuclease